jgi:hypothetical protein
MIKLDNNPKYNIGDIVILEYVFDPSGLGSMKKLDKPILVEVIRVSTTSTGYSYQLKSHQGISLGGVMYWEEDISRKVLSKTEEEENMWRTWGDH